MPKAKISFSRLRGGGNSNGEHNKASPKASRIQGSFAESISIDGVGDDLDRDDTSDCSSSSEEEEQNPSSRIHSSQQGSFPSCPPSVEQKTSLGVVSMPLPVVLEEEESDTSISNMDSDEENEEVANVHVHDREKVVEESTRSVDVDSHSQKEDDNTEVLITKDTIESGFYSSSKTVCSNTDVTCQTAPISVSQDSASEVSADMNSSKNMEDELDSRLSAIIALKELVFTQRMAIKETTKDKKRLVFKISQRDRANRKLIQRNRELEKELAEVKQLLQQANLKLSHQGMEEQQNDVVETDDESTVHRKKDETIFDLLHRMNEKRKNRKMKKRGKSGRSYTSFCQ